MIPFFPSALFSTLTEGNNRKVFKMPIEEHLATTERTISYAIELCVCCLLEKGLFEEGLLRVGCGEYSFIYFRLRSSNFHFYAPSIRYYPIESRGLLTQLLSISN